MRWLTQVCRQLDIGGSLWLTAVGGDVMGADIVTINGRDE